MQQTRSWCVKDTFRNISGYLTLVTIKRSCDVGKESLTSRVVDSNHIEVAKRRGQVLSTRGRRRIRDSLHDGGAWTPKTLEGFDPTIRCVSSVTFGRSDLAVVVVFSRWANDKDTVPLRGLIGKGLTRFDGDALFVRILIAVVVAPLWEVQEKEVIYTSRVLEIQRLKWFGSVMSLCKGSFSAFTVVIILFWWSCEVNPSVLGSIWCGVWLISYFWWWDISHGSLDFIRLYFLYWKFEGFINGFNLASGYLKVEDLIWVKEETEMETGADRYLLRFRLYLGFEFLEMRFGGIHVLDWDVLLSEFEIVSVAVWFWAADQKYFRLKTIEERWSSHGVLKDLKSFQVDELYGDGNEEVDSRVLNSTMRKLLKLRPKTPKFLNINIGNGDSTFFWWDPWTPFGSLYHYLGSEGPTRLGIFLFLTVAEVRNENGWSLPNARTERQVLLLAFISTISITEANDTPIWKIDGITYKSLQRMCGTRSWLLNQKFLGILLCGTKRPSLDMLHPLGCSRSTAILLLTDDTQRLRIPNPPLSWDQIIDWLPMAAYSKHSKLALLQGWQAAIYEIWRERNRRYHDGLTLSPVRVANHVFTTVENKCSAMHQLCFKRGSSILHCWINTG
ncbi:hypothetical protein ISN44_As11g030530 [Arabidopsis suecica]|uniref:Uncharacterized protein n=1 Tax=Arabidopsis suecica TaxID=45249 RepID=A0A8T1ZFU8_ARASU|nr:hypothetical protein ISN44_As11g030530 [Arabidopsis suecica]